MRLKVYFAGVSMGAQTKLTAVPARPRSHLRSGIALVLASGDANDLRPLTARRLPDHFRSSHQK